MKEFFQHVCSCLEAGEELVLAVVCNHSGSTPRSSGARMAVHSDGSIAGTIGGGMVEAMAMKAAQEVFANSGNGGHLRRFHLTGRDAAVSDMICGGNLDVFLQRIRPEESTLALFKATLDALSRGVGVTILTELGKGGDDIFPGPLKHWLLVDDESVSNLPAPPDPLAALGRDRFHRPPGASILESDTGQVLVEDVLVPGTVYFAGAGHVAQHTAALAAKVGFRVVVMDDREEFANQDRFPEAERIDVLSSFENCFARETVDANSYLVIVTRGHLHDKTVLGQALETEAGYVGMIGSRSKRDAIYKALRMEGVGQEAIGRVHCPIGLAIGADSPEEIAVSIVAELIRARAMRRSAHAKV